MSEIVPSDKLRVVSATLPKFPQYIVYANGRVWSKFRNAWLRPTRHTCGYAEVTLYDGKGGHQPFLLHRLILLAFVGSAPTGQQARHLNDVKLDNRLSNLAWGTPQENHRDLMRNVRHNCLRQTNPFRATGDRGVNTKFSDEQCEEMRRMKQSGQYTLCRICNIMDISETQLLRILKGKRHD